MTTINATLPFISANVGASAGRSGASAGISAAVNINTKKMLTYAALGGAAGLFIPFFGGPIGSALIGAALSLVL